MIINYSICVILSILVVLWLFLTDVKKSINQNLMIIFMLLGNVGYLMFSLSTNVQEALLANKIVYIGGCFLPLLYFFTVCEVCHVKIKKNIQLVLISIQSILFFFVCTSGFNGIYYSSAEFKIMENYVQLIKSYGPTHILYPLSLYSYLVAAITVSIIAILKKNTVNKRELGEMLFCAALAVLWYVLHRIFKFNFDTMPLSYIILMSGTIMPLYHSNLYTANENKNIIQEQIEKVGFITFNKKFEFMNCNKTAANAFSELKNSSIGKPIEKCSNQLASIIEGLKAYDSSLAKEKDKKSHSHAKLMNFKINHKFYETEIHTINNFLNKIVGYTIQFTDVTEHYRVVELTTKYNETLTKEVNEKTNQILTIQEKTILGMAQMVESRDLSTGGHIKRTSNVVRIFSDKLVEANLGLSKEFLNLVIRAAPMHDLGKIGVDDAILRKAGKFNDDEYMQMKTHAQIGGKMVKDILTGVEEESFVTVAQNVAHYHHERVNGKGYPDGLAGNAIPIEARIMALADVFDALVSKRCYKEAFPYDRAFEIIQSDAGTHFDKNLTKVFLTCRPELESYYNSCEG